MLAQISNTQQKTSGNSMDLEPITVEDVTVQGLTRFPRALVQQELGKVRTAPTFGALLRELDAATFALHQTDLFEDVTTKIGGGAQAIHITFELKEKKPYKLKVGATTSGAADEVRYEAAGTLRGFLGLGELATATVTKSAKKEHGLELAVGLRRPFVTANSFLAALGLDESITSVDVEAGGREAPWAPATARSLGRRVDGRAVRCACAARDGSRRLALEVARRTGVDDDAFGASTKCALTYGLRADGRDSAAAPTDGACADANVEVAGLLEAGDATFVKAECALQSHTRLKEVANGFLAVGGIARLGAAVGLPGRALDLAMPDRFYLGGPLRLRAFDRCGVGARRPRARGTPLLAGEATAPAVGGALLWTASLILSAPIPGDLGRHGLRALAFLDGGGLLAPGAPATLASLMAETRLACGVGLALAPAAFARLELNYGWVLRARPGDVAKGLQFGVSAAFGS